MAIPGVAASGGSFRSLAPSDERREDGSDLVSYRTLRRVVGVLGVTLPVVLALWGFAIEGWLHFRPTISDYYAFRPRDAFVGVLFTIAWFLFAYRGFDWRDFVAGKVAWLCALCVALFPDSGSTDNVHIVAAAGLFLTLAVFSLFLFTRSKGVRTPRKRIRNGIYRACGIVILVCVALIGAFYSALHDATLGPVPAIFALETLMLWAFGFSWFVKGETILKDR